MFALLWFSRNIKVCTFSSVGSVSGNFYIQALKQCVALWEFRKCFTNEYIVGTQSDQEYSGKKETLGRAMDNGWGKADILDV